MRVANAPPSASFGQVLRRTLLLGGGSLISIAVLGGCGDDRSGGPDSTSDSDPEPSEDATATTERPTPTVWWIATADPSLAAVVARNGPAGDPLGDPIPNPDERGTPATFLIEQVGVLADDGSEWHHVYLPVPPNGSTGWVAASEVTLSHTTYRLEIDTAAFELTVFDGRKVVDTFPVAVGTVATATPPGRYFIKELLVPDGQPAYGPYAYGLSGFSEVDLGDRFGDGVIGLHGTDQPESIGTAVSHGCIRLNNDDITTLVDDIGLPLGTPIDIV